MSKENSEVLLEKDPIFRPVTETLFEFRAPKHILENSLEKVKELVFYKNDKNFISYTGSEKRHKTKILSAPIHNPNLNLVNNKAFTELHEWFQDCIDMVAADLRFEPRFKIIHSWANKASKGEWHHPHTHPLSMICGTFNLTSSESGRTHYDYPSSNWDKMFFKYQNENRHFEKPEAGKLIIFPANITHGVTINNDEQARYTISFDAFPERRLGSFGNDAHDLFIKVLDY